MAVPFRSACSTDRDLATLLPPVAQEFEAKLLKVDPSILETFAGGHEAGPSSGPDESELLRGPGWTDEPDVCDWHTILFDDFLRERSQAMKARALASHMHADSVHLSGSPRA